MTDLAQVQLYPTEIRIKKLLIDHHEKNARMGVTDLYVDYQ